MLPRQKASSRRAVSQSRPSRTSAHRTNRTGNLTYPNGFSAVPRHTIRADARCPRPLCIIVCRRDWDTLVRATHHRASKHCSTAMRRRLFESSVARYRLPCSTSVHGLDTV
ncbi:hypothetical protein PENSPDRAFT_92763 [Peniophora sp. CONT]|nr:hypothetical protein PENSPDRAFT_92763 [Peniophora sp. CONT]